MLCLEAWLPEGGQGSVEPPGRSVVGAALNSVERLAQGKQATAVEGRLAVHLFLKPLVTGVAGPVGEGFTRE